MKITWHRSPSSLSSSSYRSHSSSWTDSNSKSDIFEEYGMGMTSGSHSQTLGRLYAWEKKLYDEVKVTFLFLAFDFSGLFAVWWDLYVWIMA